MRRCASSGSPRRGCRSRSSARELGATGADRVRFLFAPNPGDDRARWRKIASGGELSRVMLAVKQALARTDEVLTYVFDEVDAGVGGGTAEVIGRKLKRIAAERQVIVITHLAQVAAFADAHVRVSKTVGRGKTRVAIEPLDDERARRRDRAHAGRRRAVGPGHRPRRRDAAHRARRLTQPRPHPADKVPGAKMGAVMTEVKLWNDTDLETCAARADPARGSPTGSRSRRWWTRAR